MKYDISIPVLLDELPEPAREFVRISGRAVPSYLLEPFDDRIPFDTTSPTPWTDYLYNVLKAVWNRQRQTPAGFLVHPVTQMDLLEEFGRNTHFALSYGLFTSVAAPGMQFQGIEIHSHPSVPEGAVVLTYLGDFYPNGKVPLKQLEANGQQRLMQLAAQKLYELERDYEPELNLMMLVPEEYRYIMDAKTLPNPRVRLSAVANLKHRIKNFTKKPDTSHVAD